MAFKKQKETTDYSALINELESEGLQGLYLLWGEEDYLRESFFTKLRDICLEGGSADFNHHRIDGESLDLIELSQAVESAPFMGERSLVEVRGFIANSYKEEQAEKLKYILTDLPGFATVVLIPPISYELDGRLGLIKAIKKAGRAIEFTPQSQSALTKWIKMRFRALGKNVGNAECERLIFISGTSMTGLVQEIEKIGSFVEGEQVRVADIEALAEHIPEAKVFEMTDCIAKKRFDPAAALLAELLSSGEPPIKTLAMIGAQMRRLHTARIAIDEKLGRDFLMKTHAISNGFIAEKLMEGARGFTLPELKRAVELCAEADYRMKSTKDDDADILKELLLRFSIGGAA